MKSAELEVPSEFEVSALSLTGSGKDGESLGKERFQWPESVTPFTTMYQIKRFLTYISHTRHYSCRNMELMEVVKKRSILNLRNLLRIISCLIKQRITVPSYF